MPDCELLYHIMVNAAEDALAALEGANVWDVKNILAAEQRAEELYLRQEE